MNLELFFQLHAGAGNQPILDFLSVTAAEISPYLVIACMALFCFVTDHKGKQIHLEVTAVVVLGLLINQLITLFYFHSRPFMMDLCTPLIPHAPETSFPSDHATLLFSASLPLLFQPGWRRRGGLLFLVALAGSWGRVYTGLHFPFDIMGSFAVALAGVFVMASMRSRLLPLYDKIIVLIDQVKSLVVRKKRVSSH